MLNYIEKGAGLHRAIESAGHSLVEIDGQWHASDEGAVQAIIDSFNLDEARAPLIITIKEMARTKILAFMPEWRQSNFNARMNELNMLRFDREWTSSEQAEVAYLQAEWDKAKDIRNASNTHEDNLKALSTFEAILSYDIQSGWPEA
jgi:hypothetical protein